MNKENGKEKPAVRQSRFPISVFVYMFLSLLLMSGFHTTLIILMSKYEWHGAIQATTTIVFWGLVATGLALFTRWQLKNTYEKPVQQLAEASGKVARGDFSVFLPTTHMPDKLDYLDVMIMDFNKMVEELGSIETLKTDFFSNVSHEIKTPLAIIQNSAEFLKNGNISPEQRADYVDTILRYSRRLSDLMSNILKLNKLEKQSIDPRVAPYNICAQLAECALPFEDFWNQKNIEFEVDLEEQVIIEADESLMELVWNNLISNAIKFTEPGGTVAFRQTSTENEVIISVSDTGCGMSEHTLKHIFDKFYQGDTSHSTEGNGLGLALVQQILKMSNSSISVFSEEGVGSTFVVSIPRTKEKS